MQYVPVDGVYVYFRYDAGQTVMCIMNTNDKESEISISRFSERTTGFTKGTDIATGNTFTLPEKLKVGPHYLLVLDLKQ